ncbi:hypothetical protein I5L81_24870 [Pseudomonas aeruginosa]|nr:hypothetical protein [Pseudomonas aeruginosa]MBH3650154.1 hypothetical protein [Pseudomonas aeruginosa]MBH3696950.1 hypothetical protein [Pseudomonas aeruginosa]MBX6122900.1 hypothetical protein [Pseudomonas aeruginosa]
MQALSQLSYSPKVPLDRWIAGSLDRWIAGSLDRWIAGSLDRFTSLSSS